MADGTLKVGTITTSSGSGTITLGQSGETVQIGSGAVNNLGITMADSWRLSADTNSETDAVVSTNWEQVDESRSSVIGTSLSESSGVFTLPQTGIYLIIYSMTLNLTNDTSASVRLGFTDNNSTFDDAAVVFFGDGDGPLNTTQTTNFMFGITDTTNQKFRFTTNGFGSNVVLRGNTDRTESGFSIIRLGDSV